MHSGEVKDLKLEEVIEGKAFHDLIDELQRLQKREPIKMLRNTRVKVLNNVQTIIEAI